MHASECMSMFHILQTLPQNMGPSMYVPVWTAHLELLIGLHYIRLHSLVHYD